MRKVARYFSVPDGVAAMTVDVESVRGWLAATLVPGNGAFPSAFAHVFPQTGYIASGTRASVVRPRPVAGTWLLDIGNVSAYREEDPAHVTTGEAAYAATIRFLRTVVLVRRTTAASPPGDKIALDVAVENLAGELREPALDIAEAVRNLHIGRLLPSGLPAIFEIDVPAGAATLALQARRGRNGSALELYLYDCTIGECFLHDFTMPAAGEQTMVVRKPKAGHWLAAVNGAPFPTAPGGFVLEEIVAMPARRQVARTGPLPPRARWRETVSVVAGARPPDKGGQAVLWLEVVDRAVQRSEVEHPWKSYPTFPLLRQPPAATGTAVVARQ
jgi:hypothetical protein